MSLSRRSISLVAVSFTVILGIASLNLAANWRDATWLYASPDLGASAFEGSTGAELLTPVAAPVMTVGSCDTASTIEVEATLGTVGPTGYATLGAAFTAINGGTHKGVITIEVCGDPTETASAILNASGTGSSSYTSITISPAGGASRFIVGGPTGGTPLIDLNGADNVTIDGLNTGGNALTIMNTLASSTSGTSTVRFQGDATGNTITNADILGSSTAALGTLTGNIIFASGAVATGNDNNTISNCNLGPAGATLPTKLITFTGSSNIDPGTANSGIVINNNNFSDYFSPTAAHAAIDVNSGTVNLTISNNRFYQTATRTITITTSVVHSGVRISNTSGFGYSITGNTFGYASGTQTGNTAIVFPASTSDAVTPINLSVGTTASPLPASVQNNRITAYALSGAGSGTSSSAPFRGIYIGGGVVNVGNVTGNTIGSVDGSSGITFTSSSASASDFYGIYNFGSSSTTISNNNLGNIVPTSSSTGTVSFFGIRINTSSTAGVLSTIASNTIGFPSSSISNNATGTSSRVVGIQNDLAQATITGNVVRNISMSAANTNTGSSASVIAVAQLATANAGNIVSQNSISNLNNSNSSAAVSMSGIHYAGPTTGSNVISRNYIANIASASSSAAAIVNGININSGSSTYQNNMIALGTSMGGGLQINGINETTAGTDNFYHNSVYIAGASVTGTANSFAFQSSITSNTRGYRDNVFVNARSNGTGTGKHYILRVGGTTPNPAGLTINNNVYFGGGTGSVFGLFNASDVANLAAWKAAVGQDSQSFTSDPQFLSPAAAAPDLHIQPMTPTVIEGNGADVGVLDDFDGQTRGGLSPVDIGADAGTFVSSGDIVAPNITYTALANTASTTDRDLVIGATDAGSGVPTSGVGLPVLYFRKGAAGAFASSQCSFIMGGGYQCSTNYAAIGGVAAGDTVQYYVAAQDAAATPNVTTNPQAGASGFTANPPAASTPPATPNSYAILATLSGGKTVGAGGDYATLTAAVTALNAAQLNGPLTLTLTDPTYSAGETFPLTINANVGSSSTNTVTIKPAPGISPVVTGTSGAACVFNLNGADWVTIDGSNNGGTSRDMTVASGNGTSANAAVCLVSGGTGAGAANNVVKNLNITGAIDGGVSTVDNIFGIYSGGSATPSNSADGVDNDANTFSNNAVTKVRYGIYLRGGASNANDNNAISGNIVGPGAFNAGRISKAGIVVQHQNAVAVTANEVRFVGIQAADTGGGTDRVGIGMGDFNWTPTTTAITNAVVTGNLVHDIVDDKTFSAVGIALGTSGTAATANLVANNMIYNLHANGTSGDQGVGIGVSGGDGDKVVYNSVSLGGDIDPATATTATQSEACFRISSASATNLTLKNNIGSIDATSNTSTLKHYAVVIPSGTYNWGTGGSNNNDWFFNGGNTQAVLGGTGTSVPYADVTSLAAWRLLATTPTMDANGISSNPFFTSATDLHIDAGSGSAVNAAGTPITGVATDYDGQMRDAATPDIGADEFIPTMLPGTVQFGAASFGGAENTSVLVTVTRTGGSSGAVSVGYASSDIMGGAVGGPMCGVGVDYVSTGTQTLMWGDGDSTPRSFNVTLCSDAVADPGESFNLTLANAAGGATITGTNPVPVGITDVAPPLSGNFGVGAGQDFATIGGAMSALSTRGISSSVTLNLTDASYGSETFPLTLGVIPGASSTNTVTIKPAMGVTPAITGGSSTCLVNLNGADWVTIDGSNSGTASRDLTLTNSSTGTSSAVVCVTSLGVGAGATNDTIKNLNLAGTTLTATNGTLFGVFSGGSTISITGAGADNDNNTVQNNSVTKTQYGIYSGGAAVANKNLGTLITRNVMNGASPTNLNTGGILANFEDGIQISQNDISVLRNDGTAGLSSTAFGIALGVVPNNTVTTFTGSDVVNAAVTRNRINGVTQMSSTGYSAFGIVVNSVTSGTTLIANNMIGGVRSASTASDFSAGILAGGGTGSTTRVYFNSVAMSGTRGAATYPSYGLAIGGGDPSIDVKNNIFFNNQTSTSTAKMYAIAAGGPTFANFTSGYNDFFVTGSNGFVGRTGSLDTSGGTDRLALADWNTATAQDAPPNSLEQNPSFTTITDLHLQSTSPLDSKGTPIAGLTVDFDGEARSAMTPDMGADEFAAATNPSGVGAANPSTVAQGGVTLLTVTVMPGANPPSTGISVSADLSTIGLSATQQFFDNGGNGDVTAGDNIFSYAAMLPGSVTVGMKTLPAAIADAQMRQGTANIALTVIAAAMPGTLQFSSGTYSAAENAAGGVLAMSVTRTGGSDGVVGATVTLTSGTATGGASCAAGVDFINSAIMVSFPNGNATARPVNIPLCNDTIFEGASEAFTATLGAVTGGAALGTPSSAAGTITEDDVQPSFAFSSATYSVSEGVGTGSFAVTRGGALGGTDTVTAATVMGGTATGGASCTAGVDYVTRSATLTFNPTDTSKTLDVTFCDDSLFETPNETVNIALSSPSANTTLGMPSAAVVTITENDTAPTLQFSSATYSNGDDRPSRDNKGAAPEAATITVTRTGATENAVSVNYATAAGGTATAGAACTVGVDYISASGTLNFASGDTSRTFSVTVCADNLFEGNETVNLALSGPSAPAVLGMPNTAVLTITDNEAQPTLQFSSATYPVGEGGGIATITVTRTGAAGNAVSVNYAASNGSATGGAMCGGAVDYQNTSGTLNFAAGDLSKTFNIPICDDAVSEGDETVNLALSSPSMPAVLGANSAAVLTIVDDDLPTVQFNTSSYIEDESQSLVVTVTRVGGGNGSASVRLTTGGGTAAGGAACAGTVDYISQDTVLMFSGTETSKTVNIPLCADNLKELNETFNVALSGPSGVTLGTPASATATINETATQFSNTNAIPINNGSTSLSSLAVAGMPGSPFYMRVTLFDVTADHANDLRVLVVAPSGEKYILMAESGGSAPISGSTLTFNDNSPAFVQPNTSPTSNSYKPTSYATTPYAIPGVPGPYSEPGPGNMRMTYMNTVFASANVNGIWSLYVYDDNGAINGVFPAGSVAGGWGLELLAPTAANASLAGRVLTANGQGIRGALVTIEGATLPGPLVARTGLFGFYQFDNLPAGHTYTVTVGAKRFRFAQSSKVVSLVDSLSDITFVAQPEP